MDVQVVQHLIATTVANQLDDVALNAIIEEHHSRCRLEGSCGGILGFKSQVWATELDGSLDDIVYNF